MPALPLEPDDDVLVEAVRDTSNSKRTEWLEKNIEETILLLGRSSDMMVVGRMQGMKSAFESMLILFKDAESVLVEREKAKSIAALEEAGRDTI